MTAYTAINELTLLPWSTVNTNVANTGTNKGYFTQNVGLITLTLPPSNLVSVGDILRFSCLQGQFSILTTAGQTINFGNVVANTSITSTAVGDSIEIVCYANAGIAFFQTLSVIGNLTPV